MKVNKKCVQCMYIIFGVVLTAYWGVSCEKVDPGFQQLFTEEYPPLYEAVFARDGDVLLEFTDHPDSLIRVQAWNALINTPVEDPDILIEKVIETNTKEAWASLWLKEFSEEHLSEMNELWEDNPDIREGLSSVLGEHGNKASFSMLMNEGDSTSYNIAYAIGRLSGQVEISPEEEIQVIRRALFASDSRISQAYLYGFYRWRKDLSAEAEAELLNGWKNFYPEDTGPNQFIARILMKNNMDAVLYHFEIDDYSVMDVQLAVEILQGIARYGTTRYCGVVFNSLLDHRNPMVIQQTLRTIQTDEQVAEQLFRAIQNKVGLLGYVDPTLRLEALNTVTNPSEYKSLVLELAGDEPRYQTIKYEILAKVYSDKEFLELLMQDLETENRFYAVQQLSVWWADLDEGVKKEHLGDVKMMVLDLITEADRSMVNVMGPLIMDEELILSSEYSIFEDMLTRFKLPEDVEVYQSVSQILYARFEEEAAPLIDSLASKGNLALNRTLSSQGWDVPEQESVPSTFRTPDWQRLAELGAEPILNLQTNKGTIRLKMFTLVSPATISGMDSLITADAYDGTPFHRVVPNFVVQGGDVESADGFGGPGYVVPTEGSAINYERGIVGIASAGTDTEGSQFFIMHQWKPHLNAGYAVAGEVVEGIEVVDKILQGDIVEYAWWD